MRLLRLLTAGRSLVGLQDSAGRYHATDQRLLPKFGSAKNPFRATTLPEPTSAAGVRAAGDNVPAWRTPAVEPLTPAPAVPAPARGGFGEPAYPSQSQAPQPPVPSSASKPANRPWFGQCASKLAALLAPAPKPAKPAKPAKAAVPRLAKSPVQGELSLDAIKVVRNDLSDSDLEVIPAQTPVPQASPAPAPVPVESAETVGATWSRVSTRLFGAGKTLS
ncbi:MAG TPA: hypothetical protein VNT26_19020 [Candidatus Sulfotelmatobacter sp.]|nr:hypothetical protein [Candidatus Sulfotelmatobacter sp.]